MKAPKDREELYKRLPEIKEIKTEKLREETERIFLEDCPDYFWTNPASSTGKYHPADHRGKHGLWIHSKRAFAAYERLARSYEAAGRIDKYEKEQGKAAILLHDIFKYGDPDHENEHTVSNHDVIAADYLRRNSDLPPAVLGCIASHNGPWGEGKSPETELEQLHHSADMQASNEDGFFKILKPHPALYSVLQKPKHERGNE